MKNDAKFLFKDGVHQVGNHVLQAVTGKTSRACASGCRTHCLLIHTEHRNLPATHAREYATRAATAIGPPQARLRLSSFSNAFVASFGMAKHVQTPPLLHWVAPRAAHRGLIANNPWLPGACANAVDLFTDTALHVPATVLAAVHEAAIDYITQAPVLVVAVANNSDLSLREEREKVTAHFKVVCNARPRLKDLMRHYGLAPQLRALSGTVLCANHHRLLKALCGIPPSRLAQCIPDTAEDQRRWIASVAQWRSLTGRLTKDTDWLVSWAAANACHEADHPAAVDLIDFACRNRAVFDAGWTLKEALAASERWHEEVQARAFGRGYSREQLRERADYGPLPDEVTIEDFTFTALRSRGQIFEEGKAMHHCVAVYANDVFAGRCWLYSVTRQGTRVATLEVREAGGRYHKIQLKAQCNRKPAPETSAATQRFIAKLNLAVTMAKELAGKHEMPGRQPPARTLPRRPRRGRRQRGA